MKIENIVIILLIVAAFASVWAGIVPVKWARVLWMTISIANGAAALVLYVLEAFGVIA